MQTSRYTAQIFSSYCFGNLALVHEISTTNSLRSTYNITAFNGNTKHFTDQDMVPARNAKDGHGEKKFCMNDEFLKLILTAFAHCTRSLHSTRYALSVAPTNTFQ